MTGRLDPKQTIAVSRVSGLVLTNALIFQEILAEYDKRVQPLRRILNAPHPINAFSEHWEYILRDINYYPIFHVARELLASLTSKAEISAAVRGLAVAASPCGPRCGTI